MPRNYTDQFFPSEINRAIKCSHLLFPQPCVLAYESLITWLRCKCEIWRDIQGCPSGAKPKVLNLFVSIILVFFLLLKRETLQLIFSTLVLVKMNPIRPVSFEVEPEEWRGLKWKNTEKRKVPLHDYVQLLPVQPLILKELLHYLSSSCHNENMQHLVPSTFINAVLQEVWNWLCYCGSERNAKSNWRDNSKLKMSFTHPHMVSLRNVTLFFYILMMRELPFLD